MKIHLLEVALLYADRWILQG